MTALLGPYTLDWRAFLPRLLAYAVDAGFMHRSERTVHEQILYRLAGKNRPITYHDIQGDRIVTRRGQDVRQDILAAMAALKSLGIKPGDRVAIAGLNSTRYLTLDVAIGMLGAVSVPLYYTSPPADIDHILAASGARLLFLGFPRLLERLGELHAELPVISFCRARAPAAPARPLMSWEAFLALAGPQPLDLKPKSPVGFGDRATLRYTSGTTGRPKGVIDVPDAPRQLLQLFRTARAGDLALGASLDCDFRGPWEIPEHKAGHGSVIADHAEVPILASVPLPVAPLRTVDLMPAMLELLGAPVPEGLDGVPFSRLAALAPASP